MLDILKPLCIVRQAIYMVRCEDIPLAITCLDFKEEDLTDIIDLYLKVDYCIRAFPFFVNMNHFPESLMWDFAKTSKIEDNTTAVNPWDIEDP